MYSALEVLDMEYRPLSSVRTICVPSVTGTLAIPLPPDSTFP